MKNQNERAILEAILADVRRRILFKAMGASLARASLVVLPIAALAIAVSQRWSGGRASLSIGLAAASVTLVISVIRGLKGLGDRVHSALALDDWARLKDRISSAYEFLEEENLTEARQVQIQDAIRRAHELDFKTIFRFQWPRYSVCLPIVLAALLLSYLVPPLSLPASALAAADSVKQAQLNQLKELQKELQSKEDAAKELQDVLKKLNDIKRQFEKGEMSERDVMLELARLDENLRQKTAQMGVDNLEAEMRTIVPHLLSSAVTAEAAAALKENKLDKAAKELQKLADKVKQDNLSKEQKRELKMNMGVCAAKLGGKENGSFGADFAKASEALEKSDSQAFQSACKSMSDKLGLLKKCQGMKMASQKIGNCKTCLGQCNSNELGFKLGMKQTNKSKGGLKAGTAASGDPFGEANRLADSYRKVMKISGQAGAGPVESGTEITEGQTSQSQLDLKEVHANYAAAAEEVIEKEDIPLSHRYHVKRYFQSIRPQE